jgi:hypothetical protein
MCFLPGGDRLRYGHRIRNRGCRPRIRYRSDMHPRIGGRFPLDAQGGHQPENQQQGRMERHGNAEPQQKALTLEASIVDAAVRSGEQRHPLHIPRGRRQVDRGRRRRRTHIRKLYNLIHGSSILVGNGGKRYAAVRRLDRLDRLLLKERPADCRAAPAALKRKIDQSRDQLPGRDTRQSPELRVHRDRRESRDRIDFIYQEFAVLPEE